MRIDQLVLAGAGVVVLLSALLAWLVSPAWLLLTAFVGFNLVQSAFTGFCPAETVFRKLGMGKGGAECCS